LLLKKEFEEKETEDGKKDKNLFDDSSESEDEKEDKGVGHRLRVVRQKRKAHSPQVARQRKSLNPDCK